MLRTDLLLGDFETATSVYKWKDGELVRMVGGVTGAAIVYVPETDERGSRERRMLELFRVAGVPLCRQTLAAASGPTALVIEGAADARPLALVHDLPEPALRAGLVHLLAALRFVHSRGFVHGHIDRSMVLADPSAQFWLTGWADARPVSCTPPATGVLGDVSTDLRDLSRAFREALLRRPWPDPEGPKVHERDPRTAAGQELIDAGVKVDRDFARVLSRLVTADPRDAYTGATDVLGDVGAVERTAFDPWESVPPIGFRREVARVMRLLDNTRVATSESILHASSVDFIGPDGAGKSRLLSEIARVARSRNAIVLTAEGGARGTWGGVGALTRQLVQLLGRRSRMCLQHEEALRHLLCEPDPDVRRDLPADGIHALDGRDPLISQCTAAVTDLVRIAFRETPGLLLLDDEEHLPVAARQVWRSTGQFVQAINGSGDVLHALLVSTSSRSYPPELGADRVVVEMRSWRLRDLEKFLARAFAAPGGARDASVAIHRITSGRPGDVVGYLRELERRSLLQREGLRWRLASPLSSLPPLAGGVVEHVRRALEASGRDAASVVECLAVSRDVRLTREAVADVSDVRGPRLGSAADAAVAAGLLVLDGASWRVRSDAIAHKVYAAIPDDRRKILHREVLNRLLDTNPDAIDPIATHARASSDPRAETWTRQAIARARDAGEWETALAHVDDALIRTNDSGVNLRLLRAELLFALGRAGDVIDLLAEIRSDEYPAIVDQVRGVLLLARAHYDARQWDAVMSLAVPDTADIADSVAQFRYVRAACLAHLGQARMAAREARLAGAESVDPQCADVRLTRLEYEYQAAFYAADQRGVRNALVAKLRIGARVNDVRQVVTDRVKLGNAARFFSAPPTSVQAILVHAIARCRNNPGIGGTVRSALHAALGYSCWPHESMRRGYRHFGRSSFYAVQSGVETLVIASRIRLIAWGVSCGIVAYQDKRYVRSTLAQCEKTLDRVLMSAAVDLGLCLLYYAHQDELERLWQRASAMWGHDSRVSTLEGFAIAGRMWFIEDTMIPILGSGSSDNRDDARTVARNLAALGIGDLWTTAIAYCALRPEWRDDAWLLRFTIRGAERLARHRGHPGWGGVSVALALALWIPIPYDVATWLLLVAIVRVHRGPLPVALEWQRVLMESREYRRVGDWCRAQSARKQAESQLELLRDDEYGQRGLAAYLAWKGKLFEYGDTASPIESLALRCNRGADSRNDIESVTMFPESWHGLIMQVLSSPRVVVVGTHIRELEEFLNLLDQAAPRMLVVWRSSDPILESPRPCLGGLLLVAPNLWPTDKLRLAHSMLAAGAARKVRLTTLVSVPWNHFRGAGAVERGVAETVDGTLLVLEGLCATPSGRTEWFMRMLRSRRRDLEADESVLAEVASYEWPGGLGELEQVVQDACDKSGTRLDMVALNGIGWQNRVGITQRDEDPRECDVLKVLAGGTIHSIRDIATAIGRPQRTTLRYLTNLVVSGQVGRIGRGRATRYRLGLWKRT